MNFQMRFRHSNGNLHIKAGGGFDGEAAETLLRLFSGEYPEGGRVFIDTEDIEQIHPSGRDVLSAGLARTAVPPAALFFMGEKGFDMAPDGTRVLTFQRKRPSHREGGEHPTVAQGGEKHRCCGRCARCTCRQRHGKHEGAHAGCGCHHNDK